MCEELRPARRSPSTLCLPASGAKDELGFGFWGVPQAPGGREGLCPGTHTVFLVYLLCCMSGVRQTPPDMYLYRVTAHL